MKVILYNCIFFSILSFSINSCYTPRYVYSPSAQNIPLIHKKNDLEFSGFYSASLNRFKGKGDYNRGFDLQSAWAISNHFAVMLNESAQWEKNGTNDTYYFGDTSRLSYRRNFVEIGLGYFSATRHSPKMQVQVFGGAAFGISDITDRYLSNNVEADKYHNSNVTKIFLQPALLYSPLKNFSAAFSSRFTAVIFTHIHTNYTAEELDNYLLDSLTVSPVFFWEPAVSYAFGFKKFPVKFRVQGSLSVLINHRFIEHRSTNFGLGIFADFYKKNKSKSTSPKSS